MKDIKGVIFDMDGTLIDSMWMWGRVEADYLISLGLTPRNDLVAALRTLSLWEVARYFQVEYGVQQSIEEINTGKNRVIEEFYSNKVLLKDGVIPVLDALKARGVKMCVVTATDRYLAEPGLRRCGILDYFERIYTCEEERTSKSVPDMFFSAAAFLGTEVSRTLVVEDAFYAMKSAKNAGFPVAGVYDQSSDDQQDVIREFCDYYWKSLDEMLEYF